MGGASLISQSDKIGPSQGFLPHENAGLLLYLAVFFLFFFFLNFLLPRILYLAVF